jgi:uncharacterized membrane protein YgcG
MCVDCVLVSLRIAQVDPGDEPLPEVVLSHHRFEGNGTWGKLSPRSRGDNGGGSKSRGGGGARSSVDGSRREGEWVGVLGWPGFERG